MTATLLNMIEQAFGPHLSVEFNSEGFFDFVARDIAAAHPEMVKREGSVLYASAPNGVWTLLNENMAFEKYRGRFHAMIRAAKLRAKERKSEIAAGIAFIERKALKNNLLEVLLSLHVTRQVTLSLTGNEYIRQADMFALFSINDGFFTSHPELMKFRYRNPNNNRLFYNLLAATVLFAPSDKVTANICVDSGAVSLTITGEVISKSRITQPDRPVGEINDNGILMTDVPDWARAKLPATLQTAALPAPEPVAETVTEPVAEPAPVDVSPASAEVLEFRSRRAQPLLVLDTQADATIEQKLDDALSLVREILAEQRQTKMQLGHVLSRLKALELANAARPEYQAQATPVVVVSNTAPAAPAAKPEPGFLSRILRKRAS